MVLERCKNEPRDATRDSHRKKKGRGRHGDGHNAKSSFKRSSTVMLTFLSGDHPVPVLLIAVPLGSPCVPRAKRSFSVSKRSLIFDRFKAFLNAFKPFLSVLKHHKLKNV
jgi:hypothetical protein